MPIDAKADNFRNFHRGFSPLPIRLISQNWRTEKGKAKMAGNKNLNGSPNNAAKP